ncbi:MAG: dTDP-4-dehydrorhamnose 3,5-epimerase [Acidobacteria bacterium]|nr:dTDP-4-dehydrorhamnose 3,5-epimerase [Acidobacteriota bacterium]
MKTTPLPLDGVLLIELDLHGDERGFFIERFNVDRFRANGLPCEFVQDNHSRSRPGVIRGLHFQHTPAQGKLVGVTRGRVWDVVVDIRPNSTTFGQSYGTELTDMNGKLLWVPPGFAHGFCVLGDTPADMLYKVDAAYNQKGEAGILWNDPALDIEWPINEPIVSARDQTMPTFAEHRAAQTATFGHSR